MELAKKEIKVPADFKLYRTTFSMNEKGVQSWTFQWMTPKPNQIGNIIISIDASDGKVLSFTWRTPEHTGLKKYSLKEAQNIAKNFLMAKDPSMVKETKVDPLPKIYTDNNKDGMEVPFRFTRIVNGYPYWDNWVDVNVSTASGKVVSYSFMWDHEPIPASGPVINADKASAIINAQVGLELGYLRIFPESPSKGEGKSKESLNQQPQYQLLPAYYPKSMFPTVIDAIYGDVMSTDGKPVSLIGSVYKMDLGDVVIPKPPDRPLHMEEALARAAYMADIPSDIKPHWVSYNEENAAGFQPIWYFTWDLPNEGNKRRFSIGINALTGEVNNLESYDAIPYIVPVPDLSEEQAREAAIKYFKRLFPSKVKEVQLEKNGSVIAQDYTSGAEGKRPFYQFQFTRLINGHPFRENGIWLTIDAKGRIMNFYSTWENIQVPRFEAGISLEQATQKYYKKNPLEIGYLRLYKPDGNYEIRLVYRMVPPSEMVINARTGQFVIPHNGIPVKQ
ncbi:MAG: hypothetical protein M0Z31_05580 [Clostridia bacterium]|nr:hypothetical protein [Clostridia bacterium]